MSYKIFLSYSVQERALAEAIRNSLNKVFKNKVEFIFDNIQGGDKWKSVIQKGLKEADAIITILTPHYLKRPWAYIEWSAFWLNDKTTYVLYTDDIDIKDLVDPMRDTQLTNVFSENDITKLIESISAKCELEYIRYEVATDLVVLAKATYEKIISGYERKKYEVYKDDYTLIPNDDFKKIEILWYFYDIEKDKNAFSNIFKSINDNSIKSSILLKLLDRSDLELIEKLYEYVEAKNHLFSLIKGLIENGYESIDLTKKIINYISPSQTTLRSICEFLIKNRMKDSVILNQAITLFTNKAELRKVGECLIDNSFISTTIFQDVVQSFYGYNHAELQKLLIYAINTKIPDRDEIADLVIKLAGFNQREAEKVIDELIKRDIDLVKYLIYQIKVITNPENLNRIEEKLNTRSNIKEISTNSDSEKEDNSKSHRITIGLHPEQEQIKNLKDRIIALLNTGTNYAADFYSMSDKIDLNVLENESEILIEAEYGFIGPILIPLEKQYKNFRYRKYSIQTIPFSRFVAIVLDTPSEKGK